MDGYALCDELVEDGDPNFRGFVAKPKEKLFEGRLAENQVLDCKEPERLVIIGADDAEKFTYNSFDTGLQLRAHDKLKRRGNFDAVLPVIDDLLAKELKNTGSSDAQLFRLDVISHLMKLDTV